MSGQGRSARPAVAAAAAAIALVAAGCGDSGADPAALERKSIPAEIVDTPQSFFASSALQPVANAWRTSDSSRFTQVEAGSVSGEDSIGGLAIFRHGFEDASQSAKLVKVIGAGTLRITDAPTGKGVESFAQRAGKIEFTSESGIRGRLDLGDDTVTLQAP